MKKVKLKKMFVYKRDYAFINSLRKELNLRSNRETLDYLIYCYIYFVKGA